MMADRLVQVDEPLGHGDADSATGPGSQDPYDFEVVLVTYYSKDLVEAFLERMPPDLPIVIIDNAQGADGIAELVSDRPGTRYLHGAARGYAAAANLGIRTSTYDTIVTTTPDCAPTVAQLRELVRELGKDPRLAQVSLTSVLPDGSVELGVAGWEPTVGRAIVHAVGAHKLFPSKGLWARPTPGVEIDVEWLGGACMALRRQRFLDLGGYDESYFVYSEDTDFSRRAREAGFTQKILTGPDHLVPHLGTGSGEAKTTMLRMRGAMQMQYLGRNHSRAATQAIRLILTAGYAARIAVCRARGARPLADEHLAYVNGMWRGAPDMNRKS